MTTAGGLADQHARRAPWRARPAATGTAASGEAPIVDRRGATGPGSSAKLPVREAAVRRSRRRHRRTGTERHAGRGGARSRAALCARRTRIARLRAERCGLTRSIACAIARATLSIRGAGIAESQTRRVQSRAFAARARLAAAVSVVRASRAIGRARGVMAGAAETIATAAYCAGRAGGSQSEARSISRQHRWRERGRSSGAAGVLTRWGGTATTGPCAHPRARSRSRGKRGSGRCAGADRQGTRRTRAGAR